MSALYIFSIQHIQFRYIFFSFHERATYVDAQVQTDYVLIIRLYQWW